MADLGTLKPPAAKALGLQPMFDPKAYTALQGEQEALRGRMDQATQARETALQPIEQKMQAAATEQPQAPKLEAIPDKFEHHGMDPKGMQDAMSTMFMFAAIGGMMTRAPMTTAMNSFAGALKGFHDGDKELFDRESKAFTHNLAQARAKNQQAMEEYKAAFEKHKGSLANLKTEWDLIARRHGDTITQLNLQNNNVRDQLRHMENLRKGDQQMAQQERQFQVQMGKLDAQLRRQEEANQLARDRMAQQERLTMERIKAQRDIADQKARAKGESGGLKGKRLDSYVHNTANIESINELVNALAENPDAVGFKTVLPGIVLNRADPDGTPIRASMANITSMTIKERAGTAQTVGEMKNLAPFIPRDGDDYQTIVTKLRGMQKEMQRMNDTMLSVTGVKAPGGAQPAQAGAYSDPDKERRYQEWKARQGAPQ